MIADSQPGPRLPETDHAGEKLSQDRRSGRQDIQRDGRPRDRTARTQVEHVGGIRRTGVRGLVQTSTFDGPGVHREVVEPASALEASPASRDLDLLRRVGRRERSPVSSSDEA